MLPSLKGLDFFALADWLRALCASLACHTRHPQWQVPKKSHKLLSAMIPFYNDIPVVHITQCC